MKTKSIFTFPTLLTKSWETSHPAFSNSVPLIFYSSFNSTDWDAHYCVSPSTMLFRPYTRAYKPFPCAGCLHSFLVLGSPIQLLILNMFKFSFVSTINLTVIICQESCCCDVLFFTRLMCRLNFSNATIQAIRLQQGEKASIAWHSKSRANTGLFILRFLLKVALAHISICTIY